MNKLQTRLILSFTFVILVTLCGVSAIYSLLIIQLPQQERITYLELNTQARGITTFLGRLPSVKRDRVAAINLLEEYSQRQDIRVGWATKEFRIVYDSDNVWDGELNFKNFANLKSISGQRWTGQFRDEGQLWLIVAHPAMDSPDNQYYLILAKPVSRPIRNILGQLRDTIGVPLLQAGAIVLALGIILSISISRSIAKPLAKVSQAAQALTDGQYDVRVSTTGPQEIRDLARVFNEMTAQLQASHQAQNDLVANVAHDLRTPLTSIQGYAQALIDGTADAPEIREQAAGIIHEESRRMQQMTKTLLDLAKLQAGEIKLNPSTVDISKLTKERAEFYRKQINDAGLTFEVQSTHPSIPIWADKERLVHVLDNLINNAIAYTQPGGRIHIETTIDKSWVIMTITDTGAGIPQEDLPRIFERFYRGDKSRQGTGTGLGLSIAKQIITAHNGMIDVESIVGVGTKFTVHLPVGEEGIDV